MTTTHELPPELITEFVVAGHNNLGKVKELLAQHPDLLNQIDPQGQETALAAASHIGQLEIARYLLEQGAPLTIFAAAALGMSNEFAAFLKQDPSLAQAAGSHDIPLIAHIAISGKTELADELLSYGPIEPKALNIAMTPTAVFGHREMAAWLLEHGADVNFRNLMNKKTPLSLAKLRGHHELAAFLSEQGGVE